MNSLFNLLSYIENVSYTDFVVKDPQLKTKSIPAFPNPMGKPQVADSIKLKQHNNTMMKTRRSK